MVQPLKRSLIGLPHQRPVGLIVDSGSKVLQKPELQCLAGAWAFREQFESSAPILTMKRSAELSLMRFVRRQKFKRHVLQLIVTRARQFTSLPLRQVAPSVLWTDAPNIYPGRAFFPHGQLGRV